MISFLSDGIATGGNGKVDKVGPYTVDQVNEKYLSLLPKIENMARLAFKDFTAERKQDAIESVIVHSFIGVTLLAKQGRLSDAYFSPLAKHGIAAYRSGRIGGQVQCSTDVLADKCRRLKRSRIKYAGICDTIESEASKNDSMPVARTVQFRIDFFQTWLVAQSERNQQIIRDLAMGDTTNEISAKYGLSAGRVSQLRKEYKKSWESFINPKEDEEINV